MWDCDLGSQTDLGWTLALAVSPALPTLSFSIGDSEIIVVLFSWGCGKLKSNNSSKPLGIFPGMY